MVKTYLVSGASWLAEVEIENIEDLTPDQVRFEACTRALEAHFGMRDDIEISRHPPIKLTKEQRSEDQIHSALVDLLTTELETGCGVGVLLCVMDDKDPEEYKEGEDHEWYMNSKSILENVGVPKLVKKFNEKYPDKKKKGS